MRQVFFLLAAAMFVAFSLSWASPSGESEIYYTLPDHVLFPAHFSLKDKPEISAVIGLRDACESIESIEQETKGQKAIFSVRLKHRAGELCLQRDEMNVSVNLLIEKFRVDPSRRVDIYFREDEEKLRFFGSIEMQEELLTKN